MFNPLNAVVRFVGAFFRKQPLQALTCEQSEALATLMWASAHADGEPNAAEAAGLDGLMAELPTYWEDNGEERILALRDRLFDADERGQLQELLHESAAQLADFEDKELLVATLIATSKEHWEHGAESLTPSERAFLLPIAAWLGVDEARFDEITDDLGAALEGRPAARRA